MKEKIIYTRRIAYELRKQGFEILRLGVNEYHPELDTYIFEETSELSAALTKLSSKEKN